MRLWTCGSHLGRGETTAHRGPRAARRIHPRNLTSVLHGGTSLMLFVARKRRGMRAAMSTAVTAARLPRRTDVKDPVADPAIPRWAVDPRALLFSALMRFAGATAACDLLVLLRNAETTPAASAEAAEVPRFGGSHPCISQIGSACTDRASGWPACWVPCRAPALQKSSRSNCIRARRTHCQRARMRIGTPDAPPGPVSFGPQRPSGHTPPQLPAQNMMSNLLAASCSMRLNERVPDAVWTPGRFSV